MNTAYINGARLAWEDCGIGPGCMLLVHGWGCDHTVLAPQISHFSKSHRVIAVDLRGHGASDAPHQEYTLAGFADDLAALCRHLLLESLWSLATAWAAQSHSNLPPAVRV